MRFQVAFQGQVMATTGREATLSPDELEAELDRIMEELFHLKGEDATVSATLSAGLVEISVTVEAESFEAALEKGDALIVSAMHAAGAFTSDRHVNGYPSKPRRQTFPTKSTTS